MGRALITGASAGIGQEFARQLAQQGRDLVLVARNGERLHALADEYRASHGVDVEVMAVDLRDRAGLARVEERLRDDDRPVDVLINNAGFGVRSRFSASDLDDEQAMIDVMVTAVMRLSHAALPGMLARGKGGILVVSSVAGWLTGGTYNAAKAWATTFAESLSAQVRGSNVRVTALCPGFTRTEFHERAELDMTEVGDWMWLSSERVVSDGLRDLELGRTVSVPGAQYKALTLVARMLPRPIVRSLRLSRR
jgi:uncharacterized protein